jgi:DNA processing protein
VESFDTLTPLDPRYPARLRDHAGAPASLYWRGGSSQAERAVAIVGSRAAVRDAIAFATNLADGLARAGVVIVSGGARGIDAAAHRAALAAGGRTWLVAGTGPDRCYPADHADLFEQIGLGPGAVIWPFDSTGQRGQFLARNAVLVALADAVVVVQAAAGSGALNAACCALKQGKPLWVVPAAPWASAFAGSVQLLQEGARPLFTPRALHESLGLVAGQEVPAAAPHSSSFSQTESAVLAAMLQVQLHQDTIAQKAGLEAASVSAALLTLALENVVVEGPPGFFRRRAGL